MSKITRLEQLENVNSIYRVSGVFEKSEICEIYKDTHRDTYYILALLLPFFADNEDIGAEALQAALSNGSISIMCLQRGQKEGV